MENGRDQCSLDWRFDLSRVKDARQKDELDKRRCVNERLPGFSAVSVVPDYLHAVCSVLAVGG